jgi:hypothetical protein
VLGKWKHGFFFFFFLKRRNFQRVLFYFFICFLRWIFFYLPPEIFDLPPLTFFFLFFPVRNVFIVKSFKVSNKYNFLKKNIKNLKLKKLWFFQLKIRETEQKHIIVPDFLTSWQIIPLTEINL